MVWFSDTFDRANESLDASADWTERKGNINIVSNQAENIAAAPSVAYISSSYVTGADYYVQATLNFEATGGSSYHGIVGRRANYSTDDSDGYSMYIRASANAAYIYRRVSGSATQVGSTYSGTINTGQDYVLKLTMNGTSIEGFLDTVSIISGTDSAISASGDAGLDVSSGAVAGVTWDTFSVDTLAVGGATPKNRVNYGVFSGPFNGPF